MAGLAEREGGVHHHHKDAYSEENPIPSIQRFLTRGFSSVKAQGRHSEEEVDSEDYSDEDAKQSPKSPSARKSKTGHKDEAVHDDDRPPEERAKDKPGKRRGTAEHVTDPITERNVKVRDVRKKDFARAMNNEEEREAGRMTAEEGYKTRNAAAEPFPPLEPMPTSFWQIHPVLLPLWLCWAGALILLARSFLGTILVLSNALIGYWAFRHVRLGADDRRWAREVKRGEDFRSPHQNGKSVEEASSPSSGEKEGAEWLNMILQGLWEVIDPAIFDTMAGTLEDVMQASAPSFIHGIKVSEVAHGKTPVRFAGIKILPDREAEHVVPKSDGKDSKDAGTFSGTHINLEMSVIYHASSTARISTSFHNNARLMMSFWLGIKKVATVPLPVWVEILGFVGTARARLQLTPEAPFVKNVTFTFMGLPRVHVEVVPMRINLSNIPLLSGFVQSSIDAALAEYCAPSSLTMDLGEILMGDSIKREVNALGVIVVWIHSASDLEKQDRNGSSDPYITISYSRLGKISYATRVALDDLNPIWEERHVMLLNAEAIRAKERLSLALYDSDRLTADDILGRIEVDLLPLLRHPGKVFRRNDSLMGLSNEHKKQGQLSWSIAFFRKIANETEAATRNLAGEGGEPSSHDSEGGAEEPAPSGQEKEEMNDDPLGAIDDDTSPTEILQKLDAAESAKQTRNQHSKAEIHAPVDSLPSGVLSIQVHNILDLSYADSQQRNKTRGSSSASGGQAGSSGQLIDEVEDGNEQPDAPSPYLSIVVNDQTAMISRIKALSHAPFFNIGTERFIRDWRRCSLMIVVRDRRLRESDPILGIIALDLKELFTERNTSQVTQYFPMGGGIGHGSVRISVLFRPVEGMHQGKESLGFDIGTMRIRSAPTAVELVDSTLNRASVHVRTLVGQVKISSRRAHSSGEGDIEWPLPSSEPYLRIPARRRYCAPFLFEFRKLNALGRKPIVAAAGMWMQDLPDDEEIHLSLPIFKGAPDLHRFLQNYHDYRRPAEEVEEAFSVKKIGVLKVSVQFKSGIGKAHRNVKGHPDSVAVYEAWEACVAAGLRSAQGDFTAHEIGSAVNVNDGDLNSSGESEDEGISHESREAAEARSFEELSGSEDDEETAGRGHSSGEEDGDGERDGTTMGGKFRAWREETKERHRLHQGVKSHKVARTASWLVHSAHEGGHRIKTSLKVSERGKHQVDTEM
ncbi:hypothetical protein BCV69DRAFT_282835 [Microstroma glucosiphilum]|uniref:C2 domain-containing protein n=1 Tax=Pseudomicrostroma glucosiphilum TaxID=1684307 RepID=A0A316U5S6_9BASI|nr:hypothetical protein BCV69DRAFT_282835 [Pseudomicrostroma glucosiphilum]PWN20617.1 hypothetical protein BCV69DRAFT_282835 [Pseudomicrostroma glucosiphilum]